MSPALRPHFSTAGLRHGARAALPAFPGFIMFAVAFGTAAAQKGLSLGETLGLSAFVYAGASQMVGLEIWQQVWTPSTILTIMTVTAVVNARMILLGATLQPWLKDEPLARTALNLFLLTEAGWLVGTRYHSEGGRDVGVLLGCGIILWLVWLVATLTGFFAGALVPEPRRFGLDLVMPIFFGVMLVPLWKGAKLALPWLVAGLVSLVVHALVPGYVFIIAGALAGVAAGMLIE
ncbi:AzlC family ABC transporter permease [Microvirga tunisiensis]|jgi:predicted branched-subunit amino acid permease|uniref:Branched-chain amino acid ABC transporter permease n=1 Tax=Microvirga tunisiensis TaxID=2108360 RepID=A0A5N7MIR3_9HYPH|nr:AzlC family ABC transporter permease [Microvirga tunisiensis]MPR08772.1 branched-chain amino acid ABC transporter permease [Microvirga tunisiensis]MPR26982.1 branched-chain amino acid ABC transporter permease [Microvirga tunisiensis]